MMRRQSSHATLVVLVLSVGACLPFKYTATIAPAFDGSYRYVDGSPAIGRRVAISADYEDSTCKRPLVQATTDSSGAFLLPAAHERRWIPLQTDLAMYRYHVCVGDSTTMRAVHWSMSWIFTPGEDKLECFDWMWHGEQRVTCAPASDSTVLTGGHWQDAGGTSGWYRVFMFSRRPGDSSRVFVQWLSRPPTPTASPIAVHDVVELPCQGTWCQLARPGLTEVDGQLRTNVIDREAPGDRATRQFELGPPGEVREIPVEQ
jgi:hypothetical protein